MMYSSYSSITGRPGQVQSQQNSIVIQGQEPLTAHMLAQALPQVWFNTYWYFLENWIVQMFLRRKNIFFFSNRNYEES